MYYQEIKKKSIVFSKEYQKYYQKYHQKTIEINIEIYHRK